VPEGKGKLNCQRDRRQPTANPPIVTKPTHGANSVRVATAKLQHDPNCSGANTRVARAKWVAMLGFIAAACKRPSAAERIYQFNTMVMDRTGRLQANRVDFSLMSAIGPVNLQRRI
jgi:hypothetical protein